MNTISDFRLRLKGLRRALPELEEVLREGHSNKLCKLQNADIERNLKMESRTVQNIPTDYHVTVTDSVTTVDANTITLMVKIVQYRQRVKGCWRPNHFAAECRSTGQGQG